MQILSFFQGLVLDSLHKMFLSLDYALVGDVTLCCIPHIFIKSLNSCDVNCVPLSETSRHTYFCEDFLEMFDYTH